MPAATMAPRPVHPPSSAPPASLKHTSSHLGGLPGPTGARTLAHASSSDGRSAVVAQASADQICILDPETHKLAQCLPFWSAFPASKPREGEQGLLQCIAAGQGPADVGLMVAAAIGDQVALWSTSTPTSSSRVWRLHSSFVAAQQGQVTSLDIRGDRLLVGAQKGLSLWTLAGGGVALWKRAWSKASPKPVRSASFCPTGTLFSALLEHDRLPLVWSISLRSASPISPALTNKLRHPREVCWMEWRHSLEGPSQGEVLITRTVDDVIRIWAPVIDEPTKLRLWSATDSSAFGSSEASSDGVDTSGRSGSQTFYLGASDLARAFETSIGASRRDVQMAELGIGQEEGRDAREVEKELDQKRTRARRLEHFLTDTPDMLLKVLDDGSVVIKAVANVDRKPPTLLQSYTALRIPPTLSLAPSSIRNVSLSALKASPSAHCDAPSAVLRIQTEGGACESVDVAPALLFDGHGDGLRQRGGSAASSVPAHAAPIVHLAARHGGGSAAQLLSIDDTGRCVVWRAEAGGQAHAVAGFEAGSSKPLVDICRGFAAEWDGERVRVHDLERHSIVSLSTAPVGKDTSHQLLALRQSSEGTSSWLLVLCVAADAKGGAMRAQLARLALEGGKMGSDAAQARWLDVPLPLKDGGNMMSITAAPDDGLKMATISDKGFLESWSLRSDNGSASWLRQSTNEALPHDVIRMQANDSGIVAYVSATKEGEQTLTISDTRSSTFSSGLEHRQVLSEPVQGFAWLEAARTAPCLAVAYEHRVELLCARRLSFFEDIRKTGSMRWHVVASLDLSSLTNSSARCVAFASDGAVLVATAAQLHQFGPATSQGHLLEALAKRNGPLPDHHPQVLLQCLQWGRFELAEAILSGLADATRESPDGVVQPRAVPLERYLSDRHETASQNGVAAQASDLFADAAADNDRFSLAQAAQLAEDLEGRQVHRLDALEHAHLRVMLKTVAEVQAHRKSLDENALRYLLALRSFDLYSSPKDPSRAALVEAGIEVPTRLKYRDVLWAYHSGSQEPLLSLLNAAHPGKMIWDVARANGVFLWLRSHESLRAQAEIVARAQYLKDDARDPVKCSLFYYALGKPQLVLGLWRQAAWHPEQKKMLAFLKNDFSLERWRAAAQKNAFALLSQRRFEFAAVFFMLGDSLQDAVNVCVRNLEDWGLAVALARVKEGRDDGPVLQGLLRRRVLSLAFEKGYRWLASWAFWMLKRRDLAVRVIVTPLAELKRGSDVSEMLPPDCGCSDGHYEDASLALLFEHLKHKSLQTLRGTATIAPRTEFDFVLHINRTLSRMGCDLLGLSLLRRWDFSAPILADASVPVEVNGGGAETASALVTGEANLVEDLVAARYPRGSAPPRRSSSSEGRASSASTAKRKSSVILNDLHLGHVQEGGAGSGGAKPDRTEGLLATSPPKGASTLFTSASTLTAEPHDGANSASGTAEADEKKEKNKEPPPKETASLLRSANNEEAQKQGAMEFDMGAFGF